MFYQTLFQSLLLLLPAQMHAKLASDTVSDSNEPCIARYDTLYIKIFIREGSRSYCWVVYEHRHCVRKGGGIHPLQAFIIYIFLCFG